jgi:hypothetical protein
VVEDVEGAVRRDREFEAIADTASSTETVSASSSGCQSNWTWMPSLSRAASSRVCGVVGVVDCMPRR